MQEESIIYVFVVVLLPILIGLVTLLYTIHKDSKDNQKESMSATAKLTEAITSLRDEIKHMTSDNKKRDDKIEDLEKRTSSLEHNVTVLQNDMHHYHEEKGRV